MTRLNRALLASWMVLLALLLQPISGGAQSMIDYSSAPVNMPKTTPPNILLVLDTSRSMYRITYSSAFDPANVYGGIFDPYECYTYSSNRFQPDPAANPATIPSSCGAGYPWSGNLMNYMTMRRHDIMKWALVGGWCAVARDASGNCTRVKGADVTGFSCCEIRRTSVSAALATGRVPASVLTNVGATLNFHLMGDQPNLTGGFCADNDSTAPSNAAATCDASDTSDTYAETFYKIVVDHPENATGIINETGNKARFGIMRWNTSGSGDGGKVTADIGSDMLALGNAVDQAFTNSNTPLSESLYEAVRYFAQLPPAFAASDYSYTVLSRDPYYFNAPQWADTSAYASCCKSSVIYFTDGGQTSDTNIPVSLRDYGQPTHTLQVNAATGNFVLPIATDPNCTGGSHAASCPHHTADYGDGANVHYLDDVAYYAHITDLRQATVPVLNETGKDLAGAQNLTIYTFLVYDAGNTANQRSLLQLAARAGGFVDSNGNNLPDLQSEWDAVINATGAAGQDGLPDNFFESDQGELMKDKLTLAVTSILRQSTSGTSASVLASSITGEGAAYQAYFYPSTTEGAAEIKWAGYTHALFVDAFGNLREDTIQDGKQVYTQDNIVITRYDSAAGEVLVDRYADANGDGKADSATCSPCGVSFKNLLPIWEAGKRLALTASTSRKILTWVDTDNDGVVDAGEQIPFKAASPDNSATLMPYLRAASAAEAANIINFIRGDQIAGYRNRQLTVSGSLQVWKLGDIINSSPTIVGAPRERYDVLYGDSSYTDFFVMYKNRRQVAYVGANDGMLHAFNVGYYHRGDDASTSGTVEHGWFTRTPTDNSSGPLLGDELWGFIPYHLLPQLQWLTKSDYGHSYYVDLKPKVTDARIFTPDADHPNGWGTILIGGLRLGGSCGSCPNSHAPPLVVNIGGTNRTFYSAYFALDITNPEVDPKLLWVFADSSLGLTTSYPAVVRVNPAGSAKTDNTNARWYMVIGSGPTGYDGYSLQIGQFFAVDLKNGPVGASPFTAYPTGNSSPACSTGGGSDSCSFLGDVTSLDKDLDYRADALYGGNVLCNATSGIAPWRCNGDGSSTWAGNLYRLTTGSTAPFGVSTDPSSWGISSSGDRVPTILLGTFTCTPTPCTGATMVGPVPSAPSVAADDGQNIWVFFGTGRLLSATDRSNADTQYFFGVKDPVVKNACTQTSVAACQQNDLVNVSNATICVVCSGSTTQVTGVAGVTTLEGTATTTLQGLVASRQGWYTTLPTSGERDLVSPTVIGGIIFFPTYVPTITDVCTGSGTSSLYALFYLTGSAYRESVVGTNVVGGDTLVKRSVSLGTGMASQVVFHIGAQATDSTTGVTSRVKACTQSSTGALTCVRTNTALSVWSRYLSWIIRND